MGLTKKDLEAEVHRLQTWVKDLQSGMYVNCVYCGHRYGPKDFPASIPSARKPDMAEALRKHIESCPAHPMSKMKAVLREYVDVMKMALADCDGKHPDCDVCTVRNAAMKLLYAGGM